MQHQPHSAVSPASAISKMPLAVLLALLCLASIPASVLAVDHPQQFPPNQTRYDYIVVGSGAGGGPLACSLARNGFRVLLIESGSNYTSENSSIPFRNAVSVGKRNYYIFFVGGSGSGVRGLVAHSSLCAFLSAT